MATLALGHTIDRLTIWVFDWWIYPLVIYSCGLIWGGLIMLFLSFVLCYATMKFYDWSKTDWLGIELVKSLRDNEKEGRLHSLARWAVRKGDFFAMIILSINSDPFKVTVYMRKGAHNYNGMEKRDWMIFLGSLFLGILYWTLAVFTG